MIDIQQEHREWVDREFPGQTPDLPAAGIVEEAGELVAVLVKLKQEMQWGRQARHASAVRVADLVDAIGDCAIYVCSYCNAAGADFAKVLENSAVESSVCTPLDAAINLVRTAAEFVETNELSKLSVCIGCLRSIALSYSFDFEWCVLTTWDRVRKRRRDAPEGVAQLSFAKLREANSARCSAWHGGRPWSLSDWAVAMAGECGEACNVVKKMNRVRDGMLGEGASADMLAAELADIVCYTDLLAHSAGIDLAKAVVDKFNHVSKKHGFEERL